MSSSHLRLAVESRGLSQAEKEINVNTIAEQISKMTTVSIQNFTHLNENSFHFVVQQGLEMHVFWGIEKLMQLKIMYHKVSSM